MEKGKETALLLSLGSALGTTTDGFSDWRLWAAMLTVSFVGGFLKPHDATPPAAKEG
jgi:hypothetical protein